MEHLPPYPAEAGPNDTTLQLQIQQRLKALEVEPHEALYDLTNIEPRQIVETLDELTRNEQLVLHGSKLDQPLAKLDPTHSRQKHKPDAVYATTDARTALWNAVLDGQFVMNHLPGPHAEFGAGMHVNGDGAWDRFHIEADPESYAIMAANPPGLYRDGLVYILNRADFVPSSSDIGHQDSDHEYAADHLVKPLAALRVPASLGPHIVVIGQGEQDTLLKYDEQTMTQKRASWAQHYEPKA